MDDSESDRLLRLIILAEVAETTARALLDMEWVTDGVSGSETRFIRVLNGIATWSATVADSVVALTWIADGVSDTEVDFILSLAYMDRQNAAVAESAFALPWVIALPWVADGVSDNEKWAIHGLSAIAESSVTVAESVIALPWVADGVSYNEASFIRSLRAIAESSAAIAESVIALPWLADGLSGNETSVIRNLTPIVEASATVAESVIALPWPAAGVSYNEASSIRSLRAIAESSAGIAESVIDLPWLADGVSDNEKWAIHSLSAIAESSVAVAESVIALPWLAAGVSYNEASSISSLTRITESSVEFAESVIALPWIADGVSDIDRRAVASLTWMFDADAAAPLIDMPFLQTPDEADVAALSSLSSLTANQLANMLSRPMLKDGITDDEAPIVSMLSIVLDYVPHRVDRLLDPDKTTVERRTVELPLAGEIDLAIVRTYLGVKRSMDLLESAVREAENLMGEPFPTQYVGLLYENALSSHAAGGNNRTIMVIRPEYDRTEYDVYGGYSPGIIAHEVAHYYWRGNADWVDEGMAELMASAIENRRVGTPVKVTRPPCEFAQSLKELEALAPKPGEDAFRCNYSLGEGLFVSLLRTQGKDSFWEGARNLYTASPGAGIEEVRQAFGPKASNVIGWYEGS